MTDEERKAEALRQLCAWPLADILCEYKDACPVCLCQECTCPTTGGNGSKDEAAPQAPAIPLDAAGEPKVAVTWFERQCVQALNNVKSWRDCDGNDGFPQEVREQIDILLAFYEQRRFEPCKNGDLSTAPPDVLALLREARPYLDRTNWGMPGGDLTARIDAVLREKEGK